MRTCIQQGDLFYPADLHRNHVLATANTGKIGIGFGKNAGEWTGRVRVCGCVYINASLCVSVCAIHLLIRRVTVCVYLLFVKLLCLCV